MSLGPWGFSVAHILSRATCLIKDLTSSVCFPSISGNLERQGVGGGAVVERGAGGLGERKEWDLQWCSATSMLMEPVLVLFNCTHPSIVPPCTLSGKGTPDCHSLVISHPHWLLSQGLFLTVNTEHLNAFGIK